jgi:hypothetical protein
MRRTITLLILIGAISGCGKRAVPNAKTAIQFDQTPTAVLNAARTKRPDAKFDTVNKGTDGIYEVQGKTKSGKVIEVEVSETGEVVRVE